ncbi:MAG: response regulator, partial [Bacteroidales bacterium]|nr:response regulator [Bacteroidales bacterium]
FQSGTGLGLTSFKSIMDVLDLKYGVESQPDQGSKFWFLTNSKLIIIDDENEKESNVEIDNDIEIKSKILIVDENNPYRKSLKDILDKKYDIVFADNSNGAFEKITKEIPDLIIMSLSIQHIDGYEAIKVIRQDHNEIPIIVISNKALLHEREKAFKAGCNEFLEKPVDNELLFSVIENLINKN